MKTLQFLMLTMLFGGTAKAVLWNKTEQCPGIPARVETITEKYGEVFRGGDERTREWAWSHLSLIPDLYLDRVFLHHKLKIDLVGENHAVNQGKIDRDTRGSTDITGERPDRVWLKPPLRRADGSFHFGLIHEMGHIVDAWLYRQKLPEYEKTMDLLHASLRRVPQKGKGEVWDLPRQNVLEYVAELFDSYYCSAATRERLREQYPRDFAAAEKFFAEPVVRTP